MVIFFVILSPIILYSQLTFNLGDSKARVKRTGQGSLILHNLTPYQTYGVNVTTIYFSHTSSSLYTVKATPKVLTTT
ncbi:unnamed protein product, partial [Hymenolepis diminuta]